MTGLRASHRGYAYQDLLVAIQLIDVILGAVTEVRVDVKEFRGDRFDDMTVTWPSGHRVRSQIKHTTADRQLTPEVFSTDDRKLALVEMIAVARQDLGDHPDSRYRIVLRDTPPTDPSLTDVLIPYPNADDPGPPIPGIRSHRMQFDASALRTRTPWQTLLRDVDDPTMRAVTARLTVDVGMPAASLDVREPGPAETALLRRISEELGVGLPPNRHRDPADVALALIDAARQARTADPTVTRGTLLPKIDLAVDFGAVQQGHPVDPTVAIARRGPLDTVVEAVTAASAHGGTVVLTGGPGVGKTWLCEQLADSLSAAWTVARHHCWLDRTDAQLNQRVQSEVVIGSLIDQIDAAVPGAAEGATPRFAATTDTLTSALRAARRLRPDVPIVLIVDGLDHVTRVRGRTIGSAFIAAVDPAQLLVEELSTVDLPEGAALVIASQPGTHLLAATIGGVDSSVYPATVPPLTRPEIADIVQSYGLAGAVRDFTGDDHAARIEEAVDLVLDRSGGNTLYATYLCRQATGQLAPPDPSQPSDPPRPNRPAPGDLDDPLHLLRQVPATAHDLDTYYEYLLSALTPDQRQVVDLIAICDFAVSIDELRQMFPAALLSAPLAAVAPVITRQPGIGGIKVHHESFSRFVTADFDDDTVAPVRKRAAEWLQQRGFFTNLRAFRHLPELLIALGQDDELAALLPIDFVSRAIAGLQPPTAITHVLNLVASRAASRRDWPLLIRCVELRRTADTHREESIPGTLVEYADVIVELLGADALAAALVYDGKATVAPRWGLLLCATADAAGAPAPWDVYLEAIDHHQDNTHYGDDSDDDVRIARQRGLLRLAARTAHRTDPPSESLKQRLAGHLDAVASSLFVPRLFDVFADCLGAEALLDAAPLITDNARRAKLLLYLADLSRGTNPDLPSPRELAGRAWQADPSVLPRRLLHHGIPPSDLAGVILGPDAVNCASVGIDAAVQAATAAVLAESTSGQPAAVARWLNVLAVARELDRDAVARVQTHLGGEGFYRAWLRFVVTVGGLHDDVAAGAVTPSDASAVVVAGLDMLRQNADPFVGRPRAADLWSILGLIGDTVEEAVGLIVDADLPAATDHLAVVAERTTTSLAGMAGSGPLTAISMIGMLSRTVEGPAAASLLQQLDRVRADLADSQAIYFEMAQAELQMARLLMVADDRGEAERCWQRAAKYLACYGSHKDGTLYEFLRVLPALSRLDSTSARTRLAKLQPLAVLAAAHTDGRETNGLPREWREQLTDLDPLAAADLATEQLLSAPGLADYRTENIHQTLLHTQADTADPVVLAALRIAGGAAARSPAADTALLDRLTRLADDDPARAANLLPVIADAITAVYDDQTIMSTSGRGGASLDAALHDAARRCGGTGGTPTAPEHDATPRPASRPRAPSRDAFGVLRDEPRLELRPGPLGAIVAARDYAARRFDRKSSQARSDRHALVNAVGWRLTEAVADQGADSAIGLLRRVLTELPRLGRADRVIVDLAEGLDRHRNLGPDHTRLASAAQTLAFTSTTGGGFREFGGADRFDLWARAVELDRDTAEAVLAAEIAGTVNSGTYRTHGVTQAVVGAFAVCPPTAGTAPPPALAVFDAAFDIIAERLPGDARLDVIYTPTAPDAAQTNIDQAMADMTVAATVRPDRGDIRQALVATTILHTARPAIAQTATVRTLAADLDAGTTTWLLTVLADRPDGVPLLDDAAAHLQTLTQSDYLSVRVLAEKILDDAGRPRPAPPATPPDRLLTRQIALSLTEEPL